MVIHFILARFIVLFFSVCYPFVVDYVGIWVSFLANCQLLLFGNYSYIGIKSQIIPRDQKGQPPGRSTSDTTRSGCGNGVNLTHDATCFTRVLQVLRTPPDCVDFYIFPLNLYKSYSVENK